MSGLAATWPQETTSGVVLAFPQPLPSDLPQQTAPEVHAVAQAAADGVTGASWRPATGETALIHQRRADARHAVRLEAGTLAGTVTIDGLRDELRALGVPGVLLMHVVLGAALRSDSDRITVTVDELVKASGIDPRGAEG